jgi:hypothetical protein
VLAQLEIDLIAQRAHELHVGIEWECGLVFDKHAPPSIPTSWGLLTINEPLRGYVASIQCSGSDAPTPLAQKERQPAQRAISEEELDRLGKTPL